MPLMAFMILSACAQRDQDNKRLEEVAQIEGEQAAKADQQKQNEQSLRLERELQRRYRFYAAVSHEYTGQIKLNNVDFGVSHKSQPTIPLYTGERIRTVEEVQSDLNNLGLDSIIRFWNLKNPQAGTNCQFLNMKAFFENGSYKLQSADCGNIFSIFISEKNIPAKEFPTVSGGTIEANAANAAQFILNSQGGAQVDHLIVQRHSPLNGTTQNFQLQKK